MVGRKLVADYQTHTGQVDHSYGVSGLYLYTHSHMPGIFRKRVVNIPTPCERSALGELLRYGARIFGVERSVDESFGHDFVGYRQRALVGGFGCYHSRHGSHHQKHIVTRRDHRWIALDRTC